jgi:mannose-6-phosphate isomerase
MSKSKASYNLVCPVKGENMKISQKAYEVEKRWGKEVWFANNEDKDYCGKVLYINPGERLSLHFHVIKEEHLFLLHGDCSVTYLTQTGSEIEFDMNEGETFHIKPGLVHRFSTVNGCTLLEASTFHRDSDSYRVSI